MRVNLGALEERIDGLLMDLDMLDDDRPPGYLAEMRNIEAEIVEIRGVHARAVQHGTGYYDYEVIDG